jgi:adenylosuccinate synthase
VCTDYETDNGKINKLPHNLNAIKAPIYREFEAWPEDIENVIHKNDLPKQLMNYITFIQDEINVPVTIVSVGPDRQQSITL